MDLIFLIFLFIHFLSKFMIYCKSRSPLFLFHQKQAHTKKDLNSKIFFESVMDRYADQQTQQDAREEGDEGREARNFDRMTSW